jgi:hypothetical protein
VSSGKTPGQKSLQKSYTLPICTVSRSWLSLPIDFAPVGVPRRGQANVDQADAARPRAIIDGSSITANRVTRATSSRPAGWRVISRRPAMPLPSRNNRPCRPLPPDSGGTWHHAPHRAPIPFPAHPRDTRPQWSRPICPRVCSMFARMPRHGPAPPGIRSAARVRATGQNGSSRHVLAFNDSSSSSASPP